MATIIEKLINDAIDTESNIWKLTNQAYRVAYSLGYNQYCESLRKELYGYSDSDMVPAYRKANGNVFIICGENKYLPAEIYNHNFLNINLLQSIPSLAEYYKVEGDLFYVPYDSPIIVYPKKPGKAPALTIGINKSYLGNIFGAVRTSILDFALQLEASGVIGIETRIEKENDTSKENTTIVNITNVFGNTNKAQVQQATNDSVQESMTN